MPLRPKECNKAVLVQYRGSRDWMMNCMTRDKPPLKECGEI